MTNISSLDASLLEAERKYSGNRAIRLSKKPVKSLQPLVMRKLGRKRPMTTTTFFGETFAGLLPEAVSTQVWRSGYFSADVCRAIMHVLKPGDQFVDIGSHFGFFSLLGAHIVGPTGRTLSVEAMPQTYSYLERNMGPFVERGSAALHQGAAYDHATKMIFKDFGIVASSLNTAYQNRGVASLLEEPIEVSVTAMATDDILTNAGMTAPNVIKIDAESAELFVLRGLKNTFKTCKPALILEIGDDPEDPNPQARAIFDLLSDQGYTARNFRGAELLPFDFNGPITYANVLFTV